MRPPVHLSEMRRTPLEPLPIDAVLPALRERLVAGTRAVLHAPPGAGKTTRVPLALLEEPWLAGGRILMLEPRRLAARAAAGYMARLLGEPVGGTAGYRVRLDSRIGTETRIEVVTEGVLTRMLQQDPSLEGVGAVIFDEFHERSLHADLGLALTLQAQAVLRPELRILVMSATLDVDAVAALLGDAPVVSSKGRAHPVETVYLQRPVSGAIEPIVAGTVVPALEHGGDVLVFLPGAAEIRRTADALAVTPLPEATAVLPLYGDLPQAEQDRAIAPSPPGTRKVVLATAIAETSLTIEGVRAVVDSGMMRVPRFSPRTGMTRLSTVAVSHAAADQRRGRAGRVGPGVCYRLWTEAGDAALLAHRPPEILEADLAPLALELAAWGVRDPAELRWIDPPPAGAFAQAVALLGALEAVDREGRITDHGRALADVALHPRLAHMLLRAQGLGHGALACDLAALLAGRDVLRAHDGITDPDVRLRLPHLHGERTAPPSGHRLDRGALQRARTEARHWRRRLDVRGSASVVDEDAAGLLLALAYPDRIGQGRGRRGRFLLRNGTGAIMDARHPLADGELIVAAEVGGRGRESRIFLAGPLSRADVEHHFAAQIETAEEVGWDDVAGKVRARETRRLGALVLGERPLRDVAPGTVHAALAENIRAAGAAGLESLGWTTEAQRLRERVAFLHELDPDGWPDVSDSALLSTLEVWLLPHATRPGGARSPQDFDTANALLSLVGWERRALLERLAPTHVTVPSGSRVPVDYSEPAAPVLAVRLQEMFGLDETPRIAGGRVPLTLHLLSPARRPVQVTRDLGGFWRGTYQDVRRELRGRYPKHHWPEDPLTAQATRRTRPR